MDQASSRRLPLLSPLGGHEKLPIGGHGFPHRRPPEFPTHGHEISPVECVLPPAQPVTRSASGHGPPRAAAPPREGNESRRGDYEHAGGLRLVWLVPSGGGTGGVRPPHGGALCDVAGSGARAERTASSGADH